MPVQNKKSGVLARTLSKLLTTPLEQNPETGKFAIPSPKNAVPTVAEVILKRHIQNAIEGSVDALTLLARIDDGVCADDDPTALEKVTPLEEIRARRERRKTPTRRTGTDI